MPKFFFDLHECGRITIDDEGREFADVACATTAAVNAARDVMAGEVMAGRLCLSCNIAIRDENRCQVANVWFRDAITVAGIAPPAV